MTAEAIPEALQGAVPQSALDLADYFAGAGRRLWLVGGWVRDRLLERETGADLDFATDAPPAHTRKLLAGWSRGRVWITGFEFGTVGAEVDETRIEVTTLRSEVYRGESRKPEVTFADTIEEDLSRRDFTVNALAVELPEIALLDPWGGLQDLSLGVVRTPLTPEVSFSDDPLRMLRALRLVSTHGFRVDPVVLDAISAMAVRLEIVSRERVRDEFERLMLGTGPSRALALAVKTGLAAQFVPEVVELRLAQDPVHRHKDVLAHTLAVLDRVTESDAADPDLALRLAALLHDCGKPRTRRIDEDGVSFHHHEIVGAKLAKARLSELRFPSDVVGQVCELVGLHMRFHTYRLGWSDSAVRRYAMDAGSQLGRLNRLVRSDCTTRNPLKAKRLSERMDELESRIADLAAREELSRIRPALDGHQVMTRLGVPPGPLVGEALAFLMEIRVEEGEIGEEEALRRLDQWWTARERR